MLGVIYACEECIRLELYGSLMNCISVLLLCVLLLIVVVVVNDDRDWEGRILYGFVGWKGRE